MTKKNDIDWIIHGVCSDGKIVYHTHGLDKHGLLELELNLSISKLRAMKFINLIAYHLVKNNIKIEEEYIDKKNIFTCDVYFKKVKGIHSDGQDCIRIILPDEDELWPWDEGCSKIFKYQI